MQRLDRILSEAGVASRKELRAMIRAGRVTVDGAAVTDESRKFDETAVRVTVDGSPVRLRGPVLILLHKPAGYLTAADDPKAKTVMDLVPEAYRKLGVMPVGRLDKDTEGLLLLTNDGDLAHRILSPRHICCAADSSYSVSAFWEHPAKLSDAAKTHTIKLILFFTLPHLTKPFRVFLPGGLLSL